MHQNQQELINKLLFVQINEINKDFLLKGAKKYNCKYIISFFKRNNIYKTISPDKIQDKNLDPWVQSVSINTGKTSSKHKIFDIGQSIPKNIVQIWDVLTKKNIKCSVWGTMNSLLKKNENLKLYFPDPWNFKAEAFPKKYNKYLQLPKYYAQNYLNFTNLNFFKLVLKFGINIFFSPFLIYFIKNINFFIKILVKGGLSNYNLFFIFDLISLVLFKSELKKNSSEFALIFLNSFAHFQHNNWDEIKKEEVFFMTAEKVFEIIDQIYLNFDSILIANGFAQKKIEKIYTIRPLNPEAFLKNYINISFKKIEQNMTNGGFIYFKNNKETIESVKKLKNYHIFGLKFFKLKIITKNKIFYKINIFSKKTINKKNFSKINQYNLEDYFIFKKKDKTEKKINNLSLNILRNVTFIKTTGRHISEGFILMGNYKRLIKKSSVIKNHHIFDLINENYI